MAIILPPEQERLVVLAMQAGGYSSPQDVIARALEMLSHEERWLHDNKQGIHAKIERGIAQCDRGDFLSAEASRADMQARKDDWLAKHKNT